MFHIQLTDDGTVRMAGRLDAAQQTTVAPVFDQIDGNAVLDLGELDYISSMGLGLLVGLYKKNLEHGHTVTLLNTPKHVRDVLRYTSLEKFFIIR